MADNIVSELDKCMDNETDRINTSIVQIPSAVLVVTYVKVYKKQKNEFDSM